jgi:hypothetical protein
MTGIALKSHVSAQDLSMTIDASRTGAAIHRYVYGQFTELLGNMYEKGVWAEMLSDRKFFYPVDSSPTLNPVNRKQRFNRWRPVGPDDLSRWQKFAGVTRMVQTRRRTPHGIAHRACPQRQKYTVTFSGWRRGGGRRVWGTPAISARRSRRLSTAGHPLSSPLAQNRQRHVWTQGLEQAPFHIDCRHAGGQRRLRATWFRCLDLDGIYRGPGGNFVPAMTGVTVLAIATASAALRLRLEHGRA